MSMGARGAGGGGGGGLAISGTETEDETLTASGGTAPYSWYRYDGARQELLGTGVTRVIPATAVGYQIELVDDVADTALTGTISSSALAWIGADDYSAGIVNRGVGGSSWDLTVTGTVASASDTIGDYVNFTGAGRLQGSGTYNVGAGAAFTLVSLFDIPAAATAAGCLVDFYQSGTERLRLRHASSKLQVFDSAERDYAAPNDGACELGVWRFTGATGERSLYHGAERAAEQGVTYSNQIDSTVELAIGAFRGGGTEFTGKFRFCALYAGSLSTAKVAEVRAALKLRWSVVDQAAVDIRGLQLLCNADSGNVTERVSGSDIFATEATDLSGNSNSPAQGATGSQPLIITDPGSRWNGERVLVSDGTNDFMLTDDLDLGGSTTEFTMGLAFELVAQTSGARFFCYNDGTAYPRWGESGSGGNIIESIAAADAISFEATLAVDTPRTLIGTYKSADRHKTFVNGKVLGDIAAGTRTIADLGDFSIMAYPNGALMGDYRIAEFFISRVELSPTEVLVHACRLSAKYGIVVAA